MPSEPQSLLHHQHHSPLPHQFAKQPYSVLGAYAYRPMATHHPKAHQPEEMNENGDSRPSSRNSSIIDPGDEIDGQEDDGPSPKRLCLERAGSNSPSSDKGSSKNASSKGFLIKDILDNAAAASMANASNPMSTPNPLLASGAFMRPWAETSPEAAAAMAAANAHSYLSQLSMFQNALHQYQALAGLHPSLSHLFASVAPSSTATGVAGLSQMPPTSTPTTPFSAASLPGHLSHPLMGSLPSPSMMSSSANAAAAAAAAFRLLPNRRPRSADDDSRSERSESDSPASVNASSSNTTAGASSSSASAGSNNNNNNSSPLDALFEMTSKAFERGQDPNDKSSDPNADHLNMYASRSQAIKKKRKSRTAFTNHQIFELEKRFLYQKYLSPADRDEIAQSLGLTNAQVITWFQNRRAKLKRDVEELKKDVDAAKLGAVVPHTALLENIQDLTLLKKPELMAALHHHHQATAMAAAAAAAQQQHQAAVAAAAAAAAHQQ